MVKAINITREEYVEMFRLQGVLNDETNSSTWLDLVTEKGNVIDWFLCMSQEISEAIDSIQWKHWKDTDKFPQYEWISRDNVKTELTDVWHFLMSQIIIRGEVDEAIDLAINLDTQYDYENPREVLTALKGLQVSVLTEQSSESLVVKFFRLVISVFEDPRDLLKAYMKKNVLNQFRQDNGYKKGTYIKIWSGEEDNVYLDKYNGEYEYNAIYDYLNKNYKEFAVVDSNAEGK